MLKPDRGAGLRTAAAQQRVPDRGGDVERLLVAELPGSGRPGELARLAGVPQVVVAGPAEAQVGEDPAQRRIAQPAYRLGGELELPGVTGQVPLPLQLALDAAQRFNVVYGLSPEGPPDRFLVDVVQARARVILAERRFQLGQVGELGHGRGGVAEAERLLAGHLDTAGHGGPVEVRAPGPERIGQPGHLGGQPGVVECAGHQPGELFALFVAE